MSAPIHSDGKSPEEAQENIDRSVEAAMDLEFATLEEAKAAFGSCGDE